MTPIYYHPKQQVANPFISVQKIPKFVRQSGLEALGFEPFTVEDLCLAHQPQYVDDVLSLQTANVFNTRDPEINLALHYANHSRCGASLLGWCQHFRYFTPLRQFIGLDRGQVRRTAQHGFITVGFCKGLELGGQMDAPDLGVDFVDHLRR